MDNGTGRKKLEVQRMAFANPYSKIYYSILENALINEPFDILVGKGLDAKGYSGIMYMNSEISKIYRHFAKIEDENIKRKDMVFIDDIWVEHHNRLQGHGTRGLSEFLESFTDYFVVMWFKPVYGCAKTLTPEKMKSQQDAFKSFCEKNNFTDISQWVDNPQQPFMYYVLNNESGKIFLNSLK